MNIREWKRLRSKVEMLRKNRRDFAAVAWASIGIVGSSILSLLTWLPAYKSLSSDEMLEFAWVHPAMISAAVAGVIVAGISFVASSLFGQDEQSTAKEIVEDMNELLNSDR